MGNGARRGPGSGPWRARGKLPPPVDTQTTFLLALGLLAAASLAVAAAGFTLFARDRRAHRAARLPTEHRGAVEER